MTNNIPEELIKDKLFTWTSSNKIQEILGLTSMDAALFKKELSALESKGIIERAGAKKGLKFRYKNKQQTEAQPSVEHNAPVKEEKKKKKAKIDIEDIPCAVSNMDRHEFTDDVNNVTINKLMLFLLKNPGEHSFSVSIKRTAKGFCIKTYRDIFLMSEVFYTKESFIMLLKASEITLE